MKIKARSYTCKGGSTKRDKKIRKSLQKAFRQDMKRATKDAKESSNYKEVRIVLLSYRF